MNFILDEMLALQLAKGLREFGKTVYHITERLPSGSKDVEVLKYIGENNEILITRDGRINKNPAEKQAINKFSVGVFELVGKEMSLWEQAKQIVRSWDQIEEKANSIKSPFIFKVSRAGRKLDRLR